MSPGPFGRTSADSPDARYQPKPPDNGRARPPSGLVPRKCPRQDSNLRHRLRRPVLYPLSYEGVRRARDPVASGRPSRRREANCSAASGPRRDHTRTHRPMAACRRRILAPPCPPETSSPEAISRALAAVAERRRAGPRRRPPIRCTSSARPGGSTVTGRPMWPWSRPSGPGPTPAPWPTSLVDALEADPPAHTARHRGRRARVHQLPARRRLAVRRPGASCSDQGEEGYARPDVGHGERVQVEFISANPTGPIHVGNGWWGSYGDALARVLDRSGLPGQPRVLRQRHRRPDPDPRG